MVLKKTDDYVYFFVNHRVLIIPKHTISVSFGKLEDGYHLVRYLSVNIIESVKMTTEELKEVLKYFNMEIDIEKVDFNIKDISCE